MSDAGGEQVWGGSRPAAIPAALKALARHYTVAMHRPVSTRTLWLDTADWRLRHQGLALTASAEADSEASTLELTGPDKVPLTAGPDTRRWPRLLAALP